MKIVLFVMPQGTVWCLQRHGTTLAIPVRAAKQMTCAGDGPLQPEAAMLGKFSLCAEAVEGGSCVLKDGCKLNKNANH